MTILSGSTIEASDVNNAGSTIYQQLLAENQRVPSVTWFNAYFDNITASTTLAKRTKNIIIPDDFLLAEIAVTTGLLAGNLTITVVSGAMIETIEITKNNLSRC